MRSTLLSLVALGLCNIASISCDESPPPKETKVATHVNEHAIPSLVNLTARPSTVVNGCVNVITGDYFDSDQDDILSGPDPYVLGHNYCSSSLEEGNLGDGWSFLHHHHIEVFQPDRINYVRKGEQDVEVPTLLPLESLERLALQKEFDFRISPEMTEGSLNEDDDSDNQLSEPRLVAKGHHFESEKPTYPLFLSLYEPSGGRLLFKADVDLFHKERSLRHFKLETAKSGFTNVMGGQISGQTNIKNIRLSWDKEEDRFTVVYGNGTERVYERQKTLREMKRKSRRHAEYYRDYQLHKEVKPSGNIVIYRYNDKHEISNITTYNKDLSHKLHSLDFEQKKTTAFAKHPSLHVKTSDGLEHVYYFKKLQGSLKHGTYSVSGIKRQGWPYVDYTYSKASSRHKRRLIKKEHKDHSYIKNKYYRWEDNHVGSRHIVPENKKESKFLHNRVRLQTAPVGPKGQEAITHRYFYHKGPKGTGWTTVRQPYGIVSRYYWNKHKRLTRIKRSTSDGKVLKTERFFWGKEGSHNEGCLLSHVLYSEKDSPKLARLLHYDSRGNVLQDTLYSRFTENSGALRVEKGVPHHESCDKISTKYTYSDDGFNLKTSECDADGNFTYYEYVKGTNLLKAKLICDEKSIKRREFFRYDKNAIMIEHIVDDGSSSDKESLKHITERHITRITPRTERPHFGDPEVIEEYYLDLDKEKEILLTKTIHHYSDKGFLRKKTLLADGETPYEYDYDDIGRLTYTKDPLGQEIFYTYNKAGLLSKKRGPRQDVTWYYLYDRAGRLIEEQEVQEHGFQLTTRYEYDQLSRKISETNPQGQTFSYKYDELDRVVEINSPITYDHHGNEVRPTKYYTYKDLGTEVIETDENGHETVTSYNALGKITQQKFADGTERHLFYDLMGNLVKEIAANDALTYNYYDAFKRLKVSRVMKDGKLLSRKEVEYNSFHPVKEIGPCEETVTYRYDFAGRKISASQEERLITYDYDAKGRLLHEKRHLDKEKWIGKRYRYDELDRVIYEKNHDSSHRVATYKIYGYDAEGNRSSLTQNIDANIATTTQSFKPHGLPQTITDAEGNQTHFSYFHFFKNDYGQTVFRRDRLDARGCTDEERFDARHNLDEVLRYDPYGRVIAKKKLFYDASNNLLRLHESVIVNGQEQKVIVTLLTYGPYKRLDSITEASGTPEEKTTRYLYNKYGQRETTIFADGTKLHHAYDAKGRLERYYAQDGTIDYSYTYDDSDRIKKVTNNLTKGVTKRKYNAFGEMVSETLETGLKLHYSYDKAGRIQELTLPDSSKIAYAYSPTFLQSITRIHGEERYSHTINERDLSGNIKSCELAKNAGTLTYNYDRLNRRTKTTHACFKEEALSFDPVGNLLELKTGEDHRLFRYDFLSQLLEEKGPTSHTYSYDSLFNRRDKDARPYEVNSLHAVLSDSLHTFTYDARGNRQSNGETSYKYDALDRLTEVRKASKNYTYCYDAFGRRLSKSDGQTTTKYLYAGNNEIGAVDAQGKISELRLLGEGLGAEIGAAVALELHDTLYIPLHDRQGNITTLLDAQGQVVESSRYDAFGPESPSSLNPWQFSSKRLDPESGLIYFGCRYYDPNLGVWLTQDPLGLKAGPNLYVYCVNNPLTHIDPYGLMEEEQAGNVGPERSLGERVWDGIKDVGRIARDLTCKAFEKIVHHMPHIGTANDKLEDMFRGWRGSKPKIRPPAGLYHIKSGNANSTGSGPWAYANGLNCDFDDAKKNALTISEQLADKSSDIYLLYSPSDGICTDFARAIYNMFGGETSNIGPIAAGIEQLCDQAKASGTTVTLVPHSNGGQTCYLASKGIAIKKLENTKVLSIASTKIFDRSHGFMTAENVSGWSDLVTEISDPIGSIWRGLFNHGNYRKIGHPFHFPFSQHGFRSREYQNALREYIYQN